ncbi:MAG: glycosyltransferase [Bacteroidetes bacterium]|nr:glycosyltransferase [Bacteroidota bacterium]
MDNNSQPLVSVIMPAYNCEKYIRQAINSILNQTYNNFEFLISDDGSIDNTRKIIDSYTDPRIKRFHQDDNIGYLQTWNRLMEKAHGEYITFQDADDYSTHERLYKLIEAFNIDTNTNIGAIGSNFCSVNDKDKILFKSNFSLYYSCISKSISNKWEVLGSGIMIKREVYNEIGGYNEFFDRIGGEDLYWIYLISKKFIIKNIPDYLYHYRFNPNSVMGDLSLNPEKIVVSEVLNEIINKNENEGISLEKNSKYFHDMKSTLIENIENLNGGILAYIGRRRFYEGHKFLGLKFSFKAIFTASNKMVQTRDFLYLLKSTLIKK